MRIISLGLALFLFLVTHGYASDLAWDPSAGGPDGYKIYTTDSNGVSKGKVIKPGDYSANATRVRYSDFEKKLNLKVGETYMIYVTAWNDYGESGPSNTVSYDRPAFVPENSEWPSLVTVTVTVPVNCEIGQ